MFEPQAEPRLFGMPLGVDFAELLVEGLLARLTTKPPEALAKVEIYVNTTRMQRSVRRLFAARGARLLPQIRLLADIADDPTLDVPPAVDPLARRLELAQLVRAMLEKDQTFETPDAAFDLADTLAALLEEMQDEAVPFDALTKLDVSDHSEHWQRSQKFISLVIPFLEAGAELDRLGRMRAVVEALRTSWATNPPSHPILIAGSTGSRGTTRAFMRAVSKLPQGAVVLPGVDFDLPPDIWDKTGKDDQVEDHPQFRCQRLVDELGLSFDEIKNWAPRTVPVSDARNQLVSLALRPAPVTDAWLDEGPSLPTPTGATSAITLLEAPSTRLESLAIALRLREAAETGQTAALITPDQTLARRVTAALSAWNIVPNDSAGYRLDLTPPGRLLRQTAQMMGKPVAPETLLALLKHPLVWANNRRAHLATTRHLEMTLLRGGPPVLTKSACQRWAEDRETEDAGTLAWHDWLWSTLDALTAAQQSDLGAITQVHHDQTERLTRGPGDDETDHLWQKRAGEAALATMTKLHLASDHAGVFNPTEYARLIDALLAREEIRDPFFTHPDIMIWGTLEARVQGADLAILAGLNEGSWPAKPAPDPWLNRDMRKQAGLPMPEGKIGLSAHDFQQAISAKEVWITRATRDAEAETVPARWLNRLQNLLNGLQPDGIDALRAMKERGDAWIRLAQDYDQPRTELPPAPRPSPQPPVAARPQELWVTHVETLIRDPYAIYARHVLGLKPLKPLHAEANAALRGDVIHKILQAFISEFREELPANAEDILLRQAERFFERYVSWPATRAFWMEKFARAIPWFIQTEAVRRANASPDAFEADGARHMSAQNFMLKGRADRIDRDADGALVIYDYKTGQLPTAPQQKHYNKQLPLLAAIGAANGFEGFPSGHVKEVGYIGLGSDMKHARDVFEAGEIDAFWDRFEQLIGEYMEADKGYTARRAVFEERWDQDYDILSRYGEWDRTTEPTKLRVGS
ncbi:MAG: double-strand break repair protein AddB [Pseudomonadota bacterium]